MIKAFLFLFLFLSRSQMESLPVLRYEHTTLFLCFSKCPSVRMFFTTDVKISHLKYRFLIRAAVLFFSDDWIKMLFSTFAYKTFPSSIWLEFRVIYDLLTWIVCLRLWLNFSIFFDFSQFFEFLFDIFTFHHIFYASAYYFQLFRHFWRVLQFLHSLFFSLFSDLILTIVHSFFFVWSSESFFHFCRMFN